MNTWYLALHSTDEEHGQEEQVSEHQEAQRKEQEQGAYAGHQAPGSASVLMKAVLTRRLLEKVRLDRYTTPSEA